MNYQNLQDVLTQHVPQLVEYMKNIEPKPGIFDLQLISTSVDEDAETCTTVTVGIEFVELVDGTWIVEDIYRK